MELASILGYDGTSLHHAGSHEHSAHTGIGWRTYSLLLIEIITRRKVGQEVLIRAQLIGMAILILLVLYANGNDLLRAFR